MKPCPRSNLDLSPLDVAAATPNTRDIMSIEPPEMIIRLMNATDLKRGFLAALSALKPTNLTDEQAVEIFRRRMRSRVQTYVVLIADRVAGTASLLIEPKFIHNGGTVGHIEDVAVHLAFQHHGIGAALVKHLLDVCRQSDCYKVILDCEDSVIPFYEKLGFHQWERAMRIDL
ncbi:MAG: GCN5-related N-acetyltransferase [Schlesneria sp.]|nr:GCN5-related N-acetyltransferase [Schlesneria sp.]